MLLLALLQLFLVSATVSVVPPAAAATAAASAAAVPAAVASAAAVLLSFLPALGFVHPRLTCASGQHSIQTIPSRKFTVATSQLPPEKDGWLNVTTTLSQRHSAQHGYRDQTALGRWRRQYRRRTDETLSQC